MSISGLFGQTMIHGPAAISIGNETDVMRDIIFHAEAAGGKPPRDQFHRRGGAA
jgi:hypothetical protein